MERGVSKISWLGGKFLLSDYKKDRNNLLKNSEVLRTFYKSFLGKDNITKTYYDTPDFFFKKNGINLNINEIRRSDRAELVVRYDSEKERISFLKYMPDTYVLGIKAGSSIANYFDFIVQAISELIINGLRVDLYEVLSHIQPIMVVKKKRDRWRMVGMNGLKLITSFDACEYTSPINPGTVQKFDIMELISENPTKQYDEIFNKQVQQIIREFPKIVKIQHSDLFIGYDSVLKIYLNN